MGDYVGKHNILSDMPTFDIFLSMTLHHLACLCLVTKKEKMFFCLFVSKGNTNPHGPPGSSLPVKVQQATLGKVVTSYCMVKKWDANFKRVHKGK